MKPFAAWPEWLRSFLRFQAWVLGILARVVASNFALRLISAAHPLLGFALLGFLVWAAWRELRRPCARLWSFIEEEFFT